MKSKNIAFENSLACLQHPLTLLSIALLLLNDHVLKIVTPSWWTGKLSDFAGLFFFPFIAAAGLSLVLSKFNLSRQRIGQISFGLVAIWFTLLKTVPFVNLLTAQFASLFIGGTAQLILDPTDLMALVILLPAWMMWQNQSNIVVFKKAYVSLALGVFACLASSPAPHPFDSVTALAYHNDFLYADCANSYYIVQSGNNGDTWDSVDYRRDDIKIISTLLSDHELPIRTCDPMFSQTCYMVNGTDKVFVSSNGGKSWQVAWGIPPSRRDYVTRFTGNITTYDLIIVDEGDSRYLFVALGKHGILHRQLPDGDWVQLGVEKAQPTPIYAANFASALEATRNELAICLGVALLSLLIIYTGIWVKFASDRKIVKLLSWIYFTFNLALVLVVAELVIIYIASLVLEIFFHKPSLVPLNFGESFNAFAIGVAIVAFLAGFIIWTNKWCLKNMADQNARPKVVFYTALSLIGVLLFGYLPWLLWAFGIIERYQLALTLSILASGLITASGYYLIRNAK